MNCAASMHQRCMSTETHAAGTRIERGTASSILTSTSVSAPSHCRLLSARTPPDIVPESKKTFQKLVHSRIRTLTVVCDAVNLMRLGTDGRLYENLMRSCHRS